MGWLWTPLPSVCPKLYSTCSSSKDGKPRLLCHRQQARWQLRVHVSNLRKEVALQVGLVARMRLYSVCFLNHWSTTVPVGEQLCPWVPPITALAIQPLLRTPQTSLWSVNVGANVTVQSGGHLQTLIKHGTQCPFWLADSRAKTVHYNPHFEDIDVFNRKTA